MEARKYIVLLFMFLLHFSARTTWAFNYANALAKALLFYEAQRSGRLPSNQRANWRGDSGLQDGRTEGVDLVGGYYDAGDNVKFGLPMAFTITMLSWSAIEYKNQLQRNGQYGYTLEAIRWGTDYFIKAHPEPNVLWGEVGDGVTDHECWQRPEDMTTSRRAYRIDANNPGSDLAGETAAAMAAASICFRDADPNYANSLVQHAKQLFIFADRYRGKYDSSIRIAQNFYTSKSGYMDELLWAAIWLYKATKDHQYLAYLAINAATHGGIGWSVTEFTWDVKYAGVQVLASKILMEGKGGIFTLPLQQYQSKAEYFLCACLQKNYGIQVQRTPGGLMYVRSWNNLQYVVASSFLLTVYSDYLASARQELQCPRGRAQPSELFNFAKSQVDYILGNNPRATSYMVGFGSNYPRQVHHRASSIVSIKVNNQFVSCLGGYNTWYNRKMSDPNVLNGAVVGGPDQNDNFADERYNYEQTEPASYNSGPLVGILARLQQGASRDFSLDSQMSNFTGTSAPLLETSEVSMINFDSELLHPLHVAPMPGLMIDIEQTTVASWQKGGKNYFKYAATITNKSNTTLSSLFLKINRLHGPAWGLSRTSRGSRTFTFPQWLQSLAPQKSFTFVYIHSAPRAEISVASYNSV